MMKEELLQRAYEKSKEYLYEDSSKFNLLSIIEKDRDETHVHSKIIYNLLSQNWAKEDKKTFLTLFLEEIGIEKENIYNENWEVSREKEYKLDDKEPRPDFVIESKNYIYIIEMKIDADDGIEQLKNYQKIAEREKKTKNKKEYKLFYLTLDGHKASKKSTGEEESSEENEKVEYTNISFQEHIVNWLKKCLDLVKGKENKSTSISQYIASINEILGTEKVKIKDNTLKSSKDIKITISIYEEFNDKLQVTIENFMSLLKESLKRRIKNEIIYHKEYVENYYNYTLDENIENCPGIFIILDKIESKDLYFVFKIEIASRLVGSFGFIEKKDSYEEEIPKFKSFEGKESVVKKARNFFYKCMKNINNLKIKVENETSKDKWFFLENLKGEIIDFKDISLSNKALFSLIDEDTLKEEVKNIATYVSNEIVKKIGNTDEGEK